MRAIIHEGTGLIKTLEISARNDEEIRQLTAFFLHPCPSNYDHEQLGAILTA